MSSNDRLGTDKLLKTILSLNTLSCSELELCEYTLKYGAKNDTLTDGKTIRDNLGDTFNLIRFLTLDSEGFLKIVYRYKDMFSQHEIISIIMKICLKRDFSIVNFSSDIRNVIPSISSRDLHTLQTNYTNSTTMFVKFENNYWKVSQFSVNKEIWICKIKVFGKTENSKTKVYLKIKDSGENVIADEVCVSELSNVSSVSINFVRPIPIKSNDLYKICIRRYDEVGFYFYGMNHDVHQQRQSEGYHFRDISEDYYQSNKPIAKRTVDGIEFDFKEDCKSIENMFFKIK